MEMLLKYGCVTLRAIEEKDCDLLLTMMNSPSIDSCVGNPHLPMSRSMEEEWIKTYRNSDFSIRLMIELSNGKTIGMVILQDINYKNRTAEIGIKTYVKDFHDRMVNDVDNAYYALLNFAFFELNLNCIYAYSFEDNIDSIRFNRRCGFSEDGVLRQRVFTGGVYKNLRAFSIVKDDFNKIKSDEMLARKNSL